MYMYICVCVFVRLHVCIRYCAQELPNNIVINKPLKAWILFINCQMLSRDVCYLTFFSYIRTKYFAKLL